MKIPLSWGRWLGILAVVFCVFAGGISFAADTSINWQNSAGLINDKDGAPLAAGSTNLIQFIYAGGGVYHPPAPGGDILGGGDSLIMSGPFYIGEGGGGAGTFYKYLSPVTNPSTVYVRIWQGGAAQGNYYGRSPLRSVNVGPLDAPPTFSESFNTVYIADISSKPTNLNVSDIGYDGATVSWNLDSRYELTGRQLSYGTDDNAENKGTINVSGASYTFPRLSLDPGETYYVKVRVINYFGVSDYSDIESFTTLGTNFGGTASDLRIQLSGGAVTLTWDGAAQTYEVWSADMDGIFSKIDQVSASPWADPVYTTVSATTERSFQIRVPNGQGAPETVGWHTFQLKKSTTGINSISAILDTTISGNSPTVADALGVKATIGSNFEFIGGWDKNTQTDFGYLSDGTGTNFPLKRGEGYQISVSSDTDWTIVGQK